MANIPITVIIPAYNAEAFIKKCLNSVLKQTFTNYELIVIDDGSIDLTGSIIDEYAKLDPRVVAIHQANQGVSATRQKGMELSRGMYIAFIDSDDYIASDYLEILYRTASVTKAEIVIAFCQGSDYPFEDLKNHGDKSITYCTREQTMISFLNNDPNIIHMLWSKLFKKELFEDVKFPVGRIFEDTAIMYRLLGKSENTVFINYDGYMYYMHSGSITKEYSAEESIDRVRAYYELVLYIKENYPSLTQKAVDMLYGGANGSMCMIAKNKKYDLYLIKQIQTFIEPFKTEIGIKRKVQRFIIMYTPYIYRLFN